MKKHWGIITECENNSDGLGSTYVFEGTGRFTDSPKTSAFKRQRKEVHEFKKTVFSRHNTVDAHMNSQRL